MQVELTQEEMNLIQLCIIHYICELHSKQDKEIILNDLRELHEKLMLVEHPEWIKQ